MNRDDSIIQALGDIQGLHPGTETPARQRLDAIRALVTRSLKPIRPLPSKGMLITLTLIVFIVFSVLAAVLLHFSGYHRLSLNQKLVYYLVILFSAAVLSTASVNEVIPGSRRRLPHGLSLVLATASVAMVTFILFPIPDFTAFVKHGIPCLEVGTVCAAVSGLLLYLLLRAGFSTSPVRTAVTAGLLAGLAGFAVLALHCSILNSAHVLVWHFGAMLFSAGGGALIGVARSFEISGPDHRP